jgi:predicted transcriptional regulator of viral defense system
MYEMSLLKSYIESLESKGRFFFTRKEAQKNLKTSSDTLKVMVHRLTKDNHIISLNRSCCVIVPIQYRTMGAPPTEWYLDEFMNFLHVKYYVGSLTAASYHGAAHQAVQVYQIVTDKQIRPIKLGRTNLSFLYKNKKSFCSIVPSLIPKTNEGVHLSSPELTALDLLIYKDRVGSFNTVVTVLAELAPKINAETLIRLMEKTALVHGQRLGYVLEMTGHTDLSKDIHSFLESKSLRYHSLEPSLPPKGEKNKKWHLMINMTLEIDEI